MSQASARNNFRILTRTRTGYNGSTMYDVQLQAVASGQLLWAQTFTDREQADAFERQIDRDLDDLDDSEFRRKHGIPASA